MEAQYKENCPEKAIDCQPFLFDNFRVKPVRKDVTAKCVSTCLISLLS